MRIGWIGLGKMGLPMARRLSAAGHEVVAYARNENGRERAERSGFRHVASIAETALGADVVISAISDDAALGAVVAGEDGLAAAMRQGQTFIDTSTVSPDASRAANALLAANGVAYLRAPVSGSTALAAAGTLTVIVSGPRSEYDRLAPVLSAFAGKSFYLGKDEQARTLKLVLNSLVGATSALFAEALAFGRKGGLDLESTLEVVANSAVSSPLIGYKIRTILEGTYEPAFTVAQMMKDYDIVLSVARSNHTPMPLLAQIRQQYEAAFAGGSGERDFFVLVEEAARHAGLR